MNKTFKQLSAIFVASIISTTVIANHESVYTEVPDPASMIGMYHSTVGITTSASKRVAADVFNHYKTEVTQVPYEVKVCKQVHQGTGDGSATNEIIGAIFGGAIGNQFGEGDGKDAMTFAGIFLGASLAHDDELAQGPGVLVTKCYYETRYQESVYSKVYSHSTLTFKVKGKQYRVDFIK